MANKITNPNYRKFLDEGIMEFVTEEQLKEALSNIKEKQRKQGRALLIILYYTGARPKEILYIKANDILKEGSFITIKIMGAKRGLTRKVYLQYKKSLIKELWNYVTTLPPEMFLFHSFKNTYVRSKQVKSGEIKQYVEETDKIRYYIFKWFKGVIPGSITPYFLRHNRFSKLSEAGATMQQIRQMKGSKSMKSILPYIHLSSESAKKLARKIE